MGTLHDILFTQGDYTQKKAQIDAMGVNELAYVGEGIVKEIINRLSPEAERVWIDGQFNPESYWKSFVEGFYISEGSLYVMLYIQNTKTDTTQIERFSTFFGGGKFVSSNNRLHETIRYGIEEKAEGMRSLLLTCIYSLYNEEAQRKKLIVKLSHHTIINPVFDHFFEKFDLWHKTLSKYSSRDCVVKNEGYQHGKKAVEEYIGEHCLELEGKTREELIEIYKGVFKAAFDEFDKGFDYWEWKRNNTLLW